MFKRIFGGPDKRATPGSDRSEEDQKILDAYAAYEDLYRHRGPEADDVNYLPHRIEAARALLAMIPGGKFADIRQEVLEITAREYEQLGLVHSPSYSGPGKKHVDNLLAIDDFSNAIEFRKLAGKEPDGRLFQLRGERYLRQKMADKAIEDATQAIACAEHSDAYLLRARAYSQIGNYVRARADIVYAMEIAQTRWQAQPAFDLFGRVCADVVAEHRKNLEDLLSQYKAGKRDFRGTDLSWIDLSEIDIPEVDLRDANLECSVLTGANFDRANLRGANLRNTLCHRGGDSPGHLVSFRYANLSGANLACAYLYKADLSKANLEGAHMAGAHLQESLLTEVNLTAAGLVDATLDYSKLMRTDLTGAVLTGASLRHADCTQASFVSADLSRAKLGGAKFGKARLTRANLQQAELISAWLTEADLEGAVLRQADMLEAVVTHSRLVGADLSHATLATTDFSHSDLAGASFADADLFNTDLTDALFDERELIKAWRLSDVRGISEAVYRRWSRK